jgi:hypothetical protein
VNRPIKILLQCTIPTTVDDWSIARFSQLAKVLRDECGSEGRPVFEVTMRDREPQGSPDSVLSTLDRSDFDELWLFAVDVGDGLTAEDCRAIAEFRRNGHGLMVTRDHMDLGSSVCDLAGVGAAHHFHTRNVNLEGRERDDPYSTKISWPNYHSGANGDYQRIEIVTPMHPVLANSASPTGAIRYLPSHPHEGDINAPPGEQARVIATGRSLVTGRRFNLAVAFEAHTGCGRAIAQSTFHHFADYNWDTRFGAPSFVDEPPGDAMLRVREAAADARRYVRNLAWWLAGADAIG